MDVADALCAQLGDILPAKQREFPFADLSAAGALDAASRLRQSGVMGGIGSMDGISLFEPERMVAREEFEEIALRALVASGIEGGTARSLIARARAGAGHPAEPLGKRDMARWLSQVAAALPRS
jgi:hypothetical protein